MYDLTDAMPAVVHTAPLGDGERTERAGVPVTTVERTITDVLASSGEELARSAAEQAMERGSVTRRRLHAALTGHGELARPLLARLAVVAPTGSWASKGGQALLARLGSRSNSRQTFALRQTNWLPAMPSPPTTWIAAWASYLRDHDIPWTDLDAADEAIMSFWWPLIVNEAGTRPAHWDTGSWAWSAAP